MYFILRSLMIKNIILESVALINEELEHEALDKVNEQTLLFEALDSIAVLDLILELESRLETEYGCYIQVADEKSMDAINTPFKTVATLTNFLEQKING